EHAASVRQRGGHYGPVALAVEQCTDALVGERGQQCCLRRRPAEVLVRPPRHAAHGGCIPLRKGGTNLRLDDSSSHAEGPVPECAYTRRERAGAPERKEPQRANTGAERPVLDQVGRRSHHDLAAAGGRRSAPRRATASATKSRTSVATRSQL